MKRKRPESTPSLKQTNLLSFLHRSPAVQSQSPLSSPDVIPCSPTPAPRRSLTCHARRRLSTEETKPARSSTSFHKERNEKDVAKSKEPEEMGSSSEKSSRKEGLREVLAFKKPAGQKDASSPKSLEKISPGLTKSGENLKSLVAKKRVSSPDKNSRKRTSPRSKQSLKMEILPSIEKSNIPVEYSLRERAAEYPTQLSPKREENQLSSTKNPLLQSNSPEVSPKILKAVENVHTSLTPPQKLAEGKENGKSLADEFDSNFFEPTKLTEPVEKHADDGCFADGETLTAEFDSAFDESSPPTIPSEGFKSAPDSAIADIEDILFDDWGCESLLDLSACVRCLVIGVQRFPSSTTLSLKSEADHINGTVILRDMWAYIQVFEGDIVGVLAVNRPEGWLVNAQEGFVALHPSTLISSTQLAGSMFCRRRGVLSSVFKGIDSDNKVMTVGSLVHELFQKAIVKSDPVDVSWLQDQLDTMLVSPDFLRMIYSSNATVGEINTLSKPYLPRIVDFVDNYIRGNKLVSTGRRDEFRGKIFRVVQIEDNLASSLVGLNGRVDVTVEVQLDGTDGSRRLNVPLELKTGKASYSAEHRAQLAVYTVVMSLQGHAVKSGLLVYLREGHVTLITPTRSEIRDVILLRNELVRHMVPWSADNLPEPIRFPTACQKCPYNLVCTSLLDDTISESHPVRTSVAPVPPSDVAYLRKWLHLMILESSTEQKLEPPLFGLTLQEDCEWIGQQYKYTLLMASEGTDEVAVSSPLLMLLTCDKTGSCYTVRLVSRTSSTCAVVSEQPLPDISSTYTLKKYGGSMLSRYVSGLAFILSPQYEALRNFLVQLPPSDLTQTTASLGGSTVSALNREQKKAVDDVLRCQNYMLIEGPPGTGKTHTIVAIISELVRRGHSVLLTSHTHSSVDNVLLKLLKKNVDFVRIGAVGSVHEAIRHRSYSMLTQHAKSIRELHEVMSATVMAATCLGLDNDVINKRRFDYVIVDESSQVLQPEVIRALLCSDRYIFVGDARQLGPVVRSTAAVAAGAAVSPFEMLQECGRAHIAMLTHQYRMNRVIMDLANTLTYGGRLVCGSESVQNATIPVSINSEPSKAWLAQCVSPSLENSIVVVDTGPSVSPDRCSNTVEVDLVKTVVSELMSRGVDGEDIGVMAPYRKQISMLTAALPSIVEVKTVDQYQGRDKSCVIVSCTRSRRPKETREESSGSELLDDARRLNVALTRAKHKLIVVGDVETLRAYAPLRAMFENLPKSAFESV